MQRSYAFLVPSITDKTQFIRKVQEALSEDLGQFYISVHPDTTPAVVILHVDRELEESDRTSIQQTLETLLQDITT